jgi:hypothetical protein
MSRQPQPRRRLAHGLPRAAPAPPGPPVIEEIAQLRRQFDEMSRAMNANAIAAPEYASVRHREIIRAVDGSSASCNLCCCLQAGFLRRGCGVCSDVCFTVCEFCFRVTAVFIAAIIVYLIYRAILFV